MSTVSFLDQDGPGAYALLIELDSSMDIAVGKLGSILFEPGSYCYIGSALNGLRARVARHLRRDKKTWWHIDYLLKRADVTEVGWALSSDRLECRIAGSLRCQGVESISGFGASDCRCSSHLFYQGALRRHVLNAFLTVGLTPTPTPSNTRQRPCRVGFSPPSPTIKDCRGLGS